MIDIKLILQVRNKNKLTLLRQGNHLGLQKFLCSTQKKFLLLIRKIFKNLTDITIISKI